MRTALLYTIYVALSVWASAQQSPTLDGRVTDALSRMGSSNRGIRHKAFDEMLNVIAEGRPVDSGANLGGILSGFLQRHPEQADRVKLGFINLLKADNVVDTSPARPTDDDGEYYAEAIDIVSSLNDERAIGPLVDALGTGNMALQGVLKYGQKALGPVLDVLRGNGNQFVRAQALRAGVAILRSQGGRDSQNQVLGIIRLAIVDAEFPVRNHALYEIDMLLSDRQFAPALQEFVPALRNIAQSDPFVLREPNGIRFPLRASATQLLEKMATR